MSGEIVEMIICIIMLLMLSTAYPCFMEMIDSDDICKEYCLSINKTSSATKCHIGKVKCLCDYEKSTRSEIFMEELK